jgi:DNA polymerase I-like protein with 3'-5' exonuclease and polymerase domains
VTYTVLDIETTGSDPHRHALVCLGLGTEVHPPARGRRLARAAMATPGTVIVAHTNYDLRWLMLDGATLAPGVEYHDTKVMAWMLDATQELALDALATRYLGYTPPKVLKMRSGVVMFGCRDGTLVPITEAPWDELVAYNMSDITTEAALYEALRAELQDRGLWQHFVDEEAPFSRLLVEMEATGLPFDRAAGDALLADTEARQAALRQRLVARTGCPDFNPQSGDQVARFLYEEVWTHPTRFEIPRLNGMTPERKLAAVESIAPPGVRVTKVGRDYAYGELVLDGLGLTPPKDTKAKDAPRKRPSVSGKLLNVLHGGHPWVADYVAHQGAAKLAGYLRDWAEREHNGRLHGRFDQSGTVTGRLSAKEPNMQQVSHDGAVRGLFRGDLIVGDFGGLEARLAAHFSGDPVMLDIFRGGQDLYGVLAAQAWGGPPTKANEGRGLMKVIWLSSQYGAQGETLAQTMAVAGMRGYSARKANAMLNDLRNAVPRLFEWRDEVIDEARALGYVTTLAGRRRHLPDIESAEWKQMAKAERQAVNSKVQGSAADVVRRVMLACRENVPPDVARICLQVHDEIIWERGPAWDHAAFPILVDLCEHGHGFDLAVPLTFECDLATSWADKGGSAGQVAAGQYAALGDALALAAA